MTDPNQPVHGITTNTYNWPTETVVNDSGLEHSFRVESQNRSDALYVNGMNGNVGIGTMSPSRQLTVLGDARVSGDVACSSVDTFYLGANDIQAVTFAIYSKDGEVLFSIDQKTMTMTISPKLKVVVGPDTVPLEQSPIGEAVSASKNDHLEIL